MRLVRVLVCYTPGLGEGGESGHGWWEATSATGQMLPRIWCRSVAALLLASRVLRACAHGGDGVVHGGNNAAECGGDQQLAQIH